MVATQPGALLWLLDMGSCPSVVTPDMSALLFAASLNLYNCPQEILLEGNKEHFRISMSIVSFFLMQRGGWI